MTDRAVAAFHRRMDEAQAEAMARGGGAIAGRTVILLPGK